MQFDICEFYPSTSEELLMKALDFAKSKTNVSDKEIEIILHCRKSFLFCQNKDWVKKGDSPLFDVTMGCYDGSEVCEVVGLYLLSLLGKRFGEENVGLYRDDGLAVLKNTSGPQTDRARKDLIKLFQDNGLKITVETNLSRVDFLDVTFNLTNGTFYPYRKPGSTTLYINSDSNHPHTITKQLPAMISRRISDISSSEAEFNDVKDHYDQALKQCGFTEKISYQAPKQSTNGKRNRVRNIIWFNPPHSAHVKTDVGKKFLKLLDKHFPTHHKYHKLFNRNNVKVSYSCMQNLSSIISSHNTKILESTETKETISCDCRKKTECPLKGECNIKCIVYKAQVISGDTVKNYYGISEPKFKLRFHNHNSSFRNESKENETELSKYIWSLKRSEKNYRIEWSIAAKCAPYKCGSRSCSLCLTEKLLISQADGSYLNKKSEIIQTCRHRLKYSLTKS